MDLDQQLRRLAATQWGHVSDRQALSLGLGPQQLRHRTARGEWARVTRRVLRSAAAADHPLARAQAILLDVGGTAALARTTAAAMWHLPGFEPDPLHVVRDRDPHVRRSELGIVHTTRGFDERHVTTVDGLRVVVPMRCVVDLAGEIHPARVERLIDNVVGQGWVRTARCTASSASSPAAAEPGRRCCASSPPLGRPMLVRRRATSRRG